MQNKTVLNETGLFLNSTWYNEHKHLNFVTTRV